MADSTILQPEGLEQRYERYKEKIKHFTIMNDIFMRNVLKEISCTGIYSSGYHEQKGTKSNRPDFTKRL